MKLPLLSLVALTGLPMAQAQTLIYLETFNYDATTINGSGGSDSAGWAGGYPGGNSDTTLRAQNFGDVLPNKREILDGVNNQQTLDHTNPGIIFQSTDPSWVQFFTTEVTLNSPFEELARFEMDVALQQRTREFHFTVKAGGNWYISDESFSPAFDAGWVNQQGLDVASMTWHQAPVGFEGDGRNPILPDFNAPAIGTPSGVVNGFGFIYNMQGQGNVFVDNYSLYAIPEPSTWALILGGIALAGTIIRRRVK